MTPEQIKALIAEALKEAMLGVAKDIPTLVSAALKTALPEALKPVTDAQAALATKVEAIEKAPKPEAKPEDKKEPKPGEINAEAIVAAVVKTLEPKLKLVDDMHAKSTAQEGAAANAARVKAWLKANRPNLPKASLESWEAKLIAANAKDDAGIAAAFESEIKLLTPILGADAVKPFMADFKGEGGKPGDAAGDDKAASDRKAKEILDRGAVKTL